MYTVRNAVASPKKAKDSSGCTSNRWKILKKNLIARGRARTVSTTPIMIKDTENMFLTLSIQG